MEKRIAACLLVLPMIFLTACRQGKDVWATPGETVSTALFDFSIDNVTVTDSYGALTPSDGGKLVQMDLTVTNTSDRQLTMFAEDFQLQWGDGDEDYGTCLTAVDTDMVPYSYTLEPGNSHSGIMLVEVPENSMTLTVAYQEMLASGKKGNAYFVEAAL